MRRKAHTNVPKPSGGYSRPMGDKPELKLSVPRILQWVVNMQEIKSVSNREPCKIPLNLDIVVIKGQASI